MATTTVTAVRDRGKFYDVADLEARDDIQTIQNDISTLTVDKVDYSDVPIMTMEEWEALGPEKYTDNKIYFIE